MSQEYKNYEVIISNNNSSDNTKELNSCTDYTIYHHEKSINWYKNWNFCKNKATGDITVICHDDDLYHRDYLTEIVKCFKKHSDVSLIHTSSYHFYDNISTSKVRRQRVDPYITNSSDYLIECSHKWCNINCPTVAVRSSIYKKIDFDDKYLSADYFMWFRILRKGGKICYINKSLVYYRQHNSVKKNINNFKAIKEYKEMYINVFDNKISKNMMKSLDILLTYRIFYEFCLSKIFYFSYLKDFLRKFLNYGYNFYISSLFRAIYKKIFRQLH
jgi:glycosyltransferase involved in cell wall biosynthesis